MNAWFEALIAPVLAGVPFLAATIQPGKPGKAVAPRYLSPEARRLWRALHATYTIDLPASVLLLTTLAEAWDRARECRQALVGLPLVTVDKHGGTRVHPLVVEERNCREQVARLARILRIHVEEATNNAT